MADTFDTADVSVANMSPGDIDALLEEIATSTDEIPKPTKDESAEAPAVSTDAAEANEGVTPDASEPAAGDAADGADLPAAADPEAALDQVDQELADLENMLAETISEVDAESSAKVSSPQAESSDEGSGGLAEAAMVAEASDLPAAEHEPTAEAPEDVDAGSTEVPRETASPRSEEEAVDPTPHDAPDDGSTESAEESPPSPSDEAQPPQPEGPPRSHVRTPAARLGRLIAAAGVAAVVLMDAPFANVSLKTKAILGYVGIATLIVALATWILGPALRPA